MDPHKSIVDIIKKKKGDRPAAMTGPSVKPTDGELDPRKMAADDVLSAIKSQNSSHLMEALKNFHDLHAMHKEHEDMDQESSTAEL